MLVVGLGQNSQRMRTVEAGLRLLGGRPIVADRAATLDRDLQARPRGVIATTDAVVALTGDQLQAIRAGSCQRAPWMLVPGDSDDAALQAAICRITEGPAAFVKRRLIDHLELAYDPLLGALGGLKLRVPVRDLPALAPTGDRSQLALIGTSRGAVLARRDGASGLLFVSMAPIASLPPGEPLRAQFRSDNFLGVLPLLLFVKHTLGAAGWCVAEPRATFLVDDPNLRSMRYGCLDFRRLVRAAKQDDFHTAIAMLPIDYGKTRASVATFFRRNSRHLSLMMHGIDHTRAELARGASAPEAEAKLVEAIRRMESHRLRTGLPYARVMTFPHGVCSQVWMAALSRVGFAAAVADRACPWNPEGTGEDPLYEMRPAELGRLGFPVINRFADPTEQRRYDLLFDAWLGKPLIIYGHHDFFARDNARVIELARFLNDRVAPKWQGLAGIHRSSYQVRILGGTKCVRVFSNDVVLSDEERRQVQLVIKPSLSPQIAETARIDGHEVAPEYVDGTGFVAGSTAPRTIAFAPDDRRYLEAKPQGPRPVPRARRALTEARDRGAGIRELISHHRAPHRTSPGSWN